MAIQTASAKQDKQEVDLIQVDTALNSLRASNFDTPAAVGEPIDNSIQSGANTIRIRITEGKRKLGKKAKEVSVVDEIAIGDDGCGMNDYILRRCLVLGYSSRYNDREGIGRFGVGATLAGISQARRIDVYSRDATSGPHLRTYIDLDEIASGQQKFMPTPAPAPIPERYRDLIGSGTGTLVVWSKCDRLAEGEDGTVHDIGETKAEVVSWIARAYRMFLDSGIKIEIDGKALAPHDPLFMMRSRFPEDPKAEIIFDESFEWPVPSAPERTSPVKVRMTLLPQQWREKRGAGGTTFARERRIDENEGLSILRSNREIFFGTIPKFYKSGVLEIDRWVGIEISFEPDLDECFRVRNVKRGAEPIDKLKDKLRTLIRHPLDTARKRVQQLYIQVENQEKATQGTHDEAEKAAADADKTAPKSRAGTDVAPEERKKRLQGHAEKAGRTIAEIEGKPFTIIDAEWPGKEFIEIDHLGKNTVIRLNNRHLFFTQIYGKLLAAKQQLAQRSNTEPTSLSPDEVLRLANVVQVGLDLMLVAYAKAESQHPDPSQQYGDLRTQWGLFLHNVIQRMATSGG